MTSDTVFGSRGSVAPARRVWAHGKRFELLHGDRWRAAARKAARRERAAIVAKDREFIDYIARRDPESTATLELEVPNQTTSSPASATTRRRDC